jgi:myo-inositol-1(or 4)-monophosphatase
VSIDDQRVLDAQLLVVTVFKGFREELLGAYGHAEHTRKDDNTPVTVHDIAIEEALRAALVESFPEFGYEGEEMGVSGSRDAYWLVDPIDGTSSFIRGLPFSTNMAALVNEGVVIASVIYDFVNDVVYTAVKGMGAYRDGKRIAVNELRQPGDLFVYSMTSPHFGRIQEALRALKMRTLLPVGASGSHYTMLAEGKIDGIVNLLKGKGLHDNAPGVLLCEEAGAVMLPYDDLQGVYRSQFIIGASNVIDSIERSGLL